MRTLKDRIERGYLRLRERCEGQGYVEYIFIIAFVALAAVLGLTALGVNINSAFNALSGKV